MQLVITDQRIHARDIVLVTAIFTLFTSHRPEGDFIATPVRPSYRPTTGQWVETSGADVIKDSIPAVSRRKR